MSPLSDSSRPAPAVDAAPAVSVSPSRSRDSLLVPVMLVIAAALFTHLWSTAQRDRSGPAVAGAARAGDIRMLVSDNCVACRRAARWLQDHRVAFDSCSIERDAACRADFEALGAAGTPVILVRGEPQLGFNPERLLAALHRPR